MWIKDKVVRYRDNKETLDSRRETARIYYITCSQTKHMPPRKVVLVAGLTIYVLLYSCHSKPNNSTVKVGAQSRIVTEVETKFPMWSPGRDVDGVTFDYHLKRTASIPNSDLSTGLYGFTIGQPINSYDDREYKRIRENVFVHNFEPNCSNCLKHEVRTLGEGILRGLLVTFYAPTNVLENYKCPDEVQPLSASDVLNNISKCQPYLKRYSERNEPALLSAFDELQYKAIWLFLVQGNWLVKTRNYNVRTPSYLVSRSAYVGNGFNRFTSNLSLVWVDGGIVTLINFCTPNYGASLPFQEDYFQEIGLYQSGKKQYPIMTCLITSVEEAKKSTFIDVNSFLRYGEPIR
jgi:hypothetical protein